MAFGSTVLEPWTCPIALRDRKLACFSFLQVNQVSILVSLWPENMNKPLVNSNINHHKENIEPVLYLCVPKFTWMAYNKIWFFSLFLFSFPLYRDGEINSQNYLERDKPNIISPAITLQDGSETICENKVQKTQKSTQTQQNTLERTHNKSQCGSEIHHKSQKAKNEACVTKVTLEPIAEESSDDNVSIHGLLLYPLMVKVKCYSRMLWL